MLDADDVVLAEIAAGLDLDQLQHTHSSAFGTVMNADEVASWGGLA
jgi:hypothetical protein